MVKATKNRKNLFLILKILLFIFVAVICVFQLKKLDFDQIQSIQLSAPWALIVMILLLPVNYFFEWLKWKAILKTFDTDFGNTTNFQSFMAGIITAMLTPNMQGNFLGRVYYFPRRFRSNLILLTLWSNLGQFIVALLFGLFSLIIIGSSGYMELNNTIVLILVLIIVLFLLIYFTVSKWSFRFKKWKFFQRFKDAFINYPRIKLEILLWGILRYLVFSFQFLLIIHAFGGDFSIELFLLVWQIYLWSTIAPSIILGKLFVRESIAIWVLSGMEIGEWNIIFASLTIWIVNLLIPTLIGILVCKKRTVE